MLINVNGVEEGSHGQRTTKKQNRGRLYQHNLAIQQILFWTQEKLLIIYISFDSVCWIALFWISVNEQPKPWKKQNKKKNLHKMGYKKNINIKL